MTRDRPSSGGQDSTIEGEFPSDIADKAKPEEIERFDFNPPRAFRRKILSVTSSNFGGSGIKYFGNYGGVTGTVNPLSTSSVDAVTTSNYRTARSVDPLYASLTETGLGRMKASMSITNSGSPLQVNLAVSASGSAESAFGTRPMDVFLSYNGPDGNFTSKTFSQRSLSFSTSVTVSTSGFLKFSGYNAYPDYMAGKEVEYVYNDSLKSTTIQDMYQLLSSPSIQIEATEDGGAIDNLSYYFASATAGVYTLLK